MSEKIRKIFDGMDENERYGLKFGLFPARLIPEDLTSKELVQLMTMSEEEENEVGN